MAVLVCGGAGYIGSHTVRELVKSREVVVVDNLQTGHTESLPNIVKFYRGDIRDKELLNSIFLENNIDAVMHFAADALVAESMQVPMKYFNNNVHGTQVLLESMIAHNIKKIIFSSTCAVYGIPQNLPITEDTPTKPINPYGESKLIMERMMRWVNEIHNISYVSLRYFNAAGASEDGLIGEHHTFETHLIPLVLQVPLGKREEIYICGDDYPTHDGTCIRDYIHVLDLADAHIKALDYLNNGGKSDIFNLGTEHGFTVKEVISAAERVTGHEIHRRITERRPGDPAKLLASNKKAREVLKWTPQYTSIDSIIETAWRWHQGHPDGFYTK